jgi:hypothetical protein
MNLIINGIEIAIHEDQITKLLLERLQREAAPVAALLPPATIGKRWQGGIYAGFSLDDNGQPCHLVLADTDRDLKHNWEAAKAWAAELTTTDNARDWSLPNRHDGIVLFNNLKDQFGDGWHWTSEQHAQDSAYAWVQVFGSGSQYGTRKSSEYRARAVRRLVIQ